MLVSTPSHINALPDARERQLAVRRARYQTGLWAEVVAALFLTFKGYRILARRYKTSSGEIDLVAVRGNTVAFIEVKARASLEFAQASISRRQSQRIHRAACEWIGKSPRFQTYEQRCDAVYILPAAWPVHVAGGV